METIFDTLKGLSAYPVPPRALWTAAVPYGIDLSADATADVLASKAYNLAAADVLMWLSFAPDISQGGQSFSFTDEQRAQFRSRAKALYSQYRDGDTANVASGVSYGYKGSRL